MKISKKHKTVFALLIIILSVSAAWIFLQNKKDGSGKSRQAPALTSSDTSADSLSQVSVEDGINTIELSAAAQTHSGITTIKLTQTLNQSEVITYGSVVSVQDISKDVKEFEADKAQLAKSKENFLISQKNFERVKSLYEKNLASEQDFQSSQAVFLSDQADLNSASSNLNSLKSSIVEQWGDNLSNLIFSGSPAIQRLLSFDEALIQIPFPGAGIGAKIPGVIYIQFAGLNKKIPCRFISASHLVNAQFQTSTLYYLAAVSSLSGEMPELVALRNVKVFLPVGKKLKGVFLPDSAVVWWQGKAWVYAEKSSGKFIRVEINTDNKSDGSYFVPENKGVIKAGVRIVITGTQLLLSEEFQPRVQTGGGGDND